MVDPYTPTVNRSDDRHQSPPANVGVPSGGYLSAHLRSTRDGIGYTRQGYAEKSWQTFGTSFPGDRSALILDIGPGECELAEYLRDHHGYREVEVLDMSPEVIAVATELGFQASLTDDTVEYLSAREAAYDVISLFHVLEHVPKPVVIPLLTAVRGALRSGGRLLIEVPNMGDPLNGLYFRYADFTHEVGFTEESLVYVLRQAGFGDVIFLPQNGASGVVTRAVQQAAKTVLHGLLFALNLPNGRQMRRRIGPVLSVRAEM